MLGLIAAATHLLALECQLHAAVRWVVAALLNCKIVKLFTQTIFVLKFDLFANLFVMNFGLAPPAPPMPSRCKKFLQVFTNALTLS